MYDNHSISIQIDIPQKNIGVQVSGSSKNISTAIDKGTLPFPAYAGEIEFTPSPDEQIIHTINKVLLSDIKINPIPNNYGLITYNGSTITVS